MTHRNWFAFALPVGVFASISSATLLLEEPAPTTPQQGVYNSTGTLTYTLYDVLSPAATFTGGTAGLAEYSDLGGGTIYGSRVYARSDEGTVTSIPLNAAAVAWLNTQIGQTAILGGAASSAYSPIPALSPAGIALLVLLILGLGALLARRRLR